MNHNKDCFLLSPWIAGNVFFNGSHRQWIQPCKRLRTGCFQVVTDLTQVTVCPLARVSCGLNCLKCLKQSVDSWTVYFQWVVLAMDPTRQTGTCAWNLGQVTVFSLAGVSYGLNCLNGLKQSVDSWTVHFQCVAPAMDPTGPKLSKILIMPAQTHYGYQQYLG